MELDVSVGSSIQTITHLLDVVVDTNHHIIVDEFTPTIMVSGDSMQIAPYNFGDVVGTVEQRFGELASILTSNTHEQVLSETALLDRKIDSVRTKVDDNESSITNFKTLVATQLESSAETIALLTSEFTSLTDTVNSSIQSISNTVSQEGQTRAQLGNTLNSKIDTANNNIDALYSTLDTEYSTTAVTNEAITLATSQLETTLTSTLDALSSTLSTNYLTSTMVNQAISTATSQVITNLRANIDGTGVSVSSMMSTIASKASASSLTTLAAAANVLTITGNKISGWKSYNNGTTSTFDILADVFKVTNGTTTIAPFTISGNDIIFNGKVSFNSLTNVPSFSGTTPADVVSAINNGQTTTINGGRISTGTITANAIAAGSITGTKIAAGSITTDNISTAGLSANVLKSGQIYNSGGSASSYSMCINLDAGIIYIK